MKPNFDRDRFEGQMNPAERQALYDLVIQIKPEIVCEVGTCRGGGSTYFISSALEENKKGLLYTCENNDEFYEYAVNLYETNDEFIPLKKYVILCKGSSFEVYDLVFKVLEEKKIDIVFLDGGACGITMLYDFCMFRPRIPVGGFLAAHDWDNGKSDYLKPVINNDVDFKFQAQILGFAIYQRIQDVHNQNT
jgi:predicted O-methyltransferase YrrM